MMTGLKQFTCSTCLCWFGCMTAIHKCPHCKKPFEFSPSDYHRKITCGNRGCEKKFGFYMYHASDRVVKELKQTLREEQEALMKATEAKLRRASRGAARGALSIAEQEHAFTLGLSDCCPRCGQEFEEYSEELQRRHLVECMDDKKHAEFKAKCEAAKKAALSKSLKFHYSPALDLFSRPDSSTFSTFSSRGASDTGMPVTALVFVSFVCVSGSSCSCASCSASCSKTSFSSGVLLSRRSCRRCPGVVSILFSQRQHRNLWHDPTAGQ